MVKLLLSNTMTQPNAKIKKEEKNNQVFGTCNLQWRSVYAIKVAPLWQQCQCMPKLDNKLSEMTYTYLENLHLML